MMPPWTGGYNYYGMYYQPYYYDQSGYPSVSSSTYLYLKYSRRKGILNHHLTSKEWGPTRAGGHIHRAMQVIRAMVGMGECLLLGLPIPVGLICPHSPILERELLLKIVHLIYIYIYIN